MDGPRGQEGMASLPVGEVRAFGGTATEADKYCHFPFFLAGQRYTRCTTRGHNVPWCYVDAGGKRWGECDTKVKAVPAEAEAGSASKNGTCVFPFEYQGTQYTSCAPGAGPGLPTSEQGGLWCYTNKEATSYGVCAQEVGGGTSMPGDTCFTACTTDYSPRPWCYTAMDRSRWGVCLFKELRGDGSYVWV